MKSNDILIPIPETHNNKRGPTQYAYGREFEYELIDYLNYVHGVSEMGDRVLLRTPGSHTPGDVWYIRKLFATGSFVEIYQCKSTRAYIIKRPMEDIKKLEIYAKGKGGLAFWAERYKIHNRKYVRTIWKIERGELQPFVYDFTDALQTAREIKKSKKQYISSYSEPGLTTLPTHK